MHGCILYRFERKHNYPFAIKELVVSRAEGKSGEYVGTPKYYRFDPIPKD